MKKSLIMGTVLAGLLVGWQAKALSISGEIAFGGVVTPIDASGSPALLGLATGLNFEDTFVMATSGAFADLNLPPMMSKVTLNQFQFSPSLIPQPLDPLWSLSHAGQSFSFELKDIAVDLQNDTQLNLTGVGVLRGTGYEDTWGTWNFQAGSSSGGLAAMVTFRADSAVSDLQGGGFPVADGGTTVMLLGMALTGLGYASRRFRS